ncbi:GLPGLI family protein [Flavobacterium sp.]|jgi:GLPGLI family protein|uniref:GLPGLI family protein n=1 Tax=Flavobacterium sp. TaxID=239 RepID=UPI0037BEA80D
MKKIILFILFLQTVICYSQFESGKITYGINPIQFKPLKSIDKESDEIVENIKLYAQKQIFILSFKKDFSIFKMSESLTTDNSDTDNFYNNLASLRFTSDFNYFFDSNSKIGIIQKNDGTLINDSKTDKKWEISNESKMIENYLCYKAVYTKTYIARNGIEKSIPITAWFAPSLPFNFGPKGYNGLPGLILELQELETIFICQKIELSSEVTNLNFPKGEVLNEEDYEKKVKQK